MVAAATRDFADGRWIVDSAHDYVGRLGQILPLVLEHVGSVAAGEPFKLELDARQGFLVFVRYQPGTGWHIRIPEGLVLRLIGVLRLLLAYWGKPATARFLSSPLDRIDESVFWTPPRLAPVFEDMESLAALSAALEEMEFTQPLENKAFWEDIEGMTNQALLFIISHEIAHVTERHMDLRDRAREGDLLGEFNLSLAQILLATEMEADILGAQSFAFMTLVETSMTPEDEALFPRLAARAGFAIPALFGLWDHHKKVLAAYDATEYPSSVLRHRLFVENAPRLFAEDPDRHALWADREMNSWKACVDAFQQVTIDLMALGEAEAPEGKLFWPIGSLNYGGSFSIMGISDDFDDKMAMFDRFSAWKAAVAPTLPERAAVAGKDS